MSFYMLILSLLSCKHFIAHKRYITYKLTNRINITMQIL